MEIKNKQSGITLTEVVMVIAIMTLLAAIGMPAIKALITSLETTSGTRTVISSALSGSRAFAVKERRYAGIRFQQDSEDNQYMIVIVHDPEQTDLASGFRAAEGIKPMKLPETIRVTDLMIRTNYTTSPDSAASTGVTPINMAQLDDSNPQNMDTYGKNIYIRDISTFSIIFSPSGKLVTHDVRVRNRDGVFRPDNTGNTNISKDDIINSPENILNLGIGMFFQDDYAHLGLGAESSRHSFIIYEKAEFDKSNAQERLNYLNSQEPVYINSYTGRIIISKV
ncbi:Tfp pilus assembly protein FimT/FimU [Planctomycetota bacterium]